MKIKKYALYAILLIVAVIMIFPMFWMLLFSLKHYPESYSGLWELIKSPFTFQNYTDSLGSNTFGKYFINSIIVSVCVTAANLLLCTIAAYAIARKDFPGKKLIVFSILGVLIIPQHIIMIPLYRLMVEFSWINTYYSLIVPWLITPFGIFMMKQYIETLPSEIEDAARIDGAGQWYVLFRIVFPLCKPMLTVLAVYTFLSNWNSFLFPFLFTNDDAYRTLPVGLTFYLGKQSIDWGHLMAGAGISAIPVLVLFLVFQKQIIQGLTAGALKE